MRRLWQHCPRLSFRCALRTHKVNINHTKDLDYTFNSQYVCKQCGVVIMGRLLNGKPVAVKIGNRPAHARFARRASREYMHELAAGVLNGNIPLSPGSSAGPSDVEYEATKHVLLRFTALLNLSLPGRMIGYGWACEFERGQRCFVCKNRCVPAGNGHPTPNGGGRRVPNAGTPHPPSFFALRRAPSLSTREEVFNCVSTRSGRVARSVLVHAPRRRGGTLEPACETRDPDPLSPPQRQLLKSSGALSSLSFQKDMALEPDARRLASAELRRRSLRSR